MWLFLKESSIDFAIEQYHMFTAEWMELISSRRRSPTGNAPVLYLNDSLIAWDSIGIIEYCRETFRGVVEYPPMNPDRAHAKSITMELHSGFLALRDKYPFNIRSKFENVKMSTAVKADVQRICGLVEECRRQCENTSQWLYGHTFSITDIFVGAELIRLDTYGCKFSAIVDDYLHAFRSRPYVQEWISLAMNESSRIPAFEWEANKTITPLHEMRYISEANSRDLNCGDASSLEKCAPRTLHTVRIRLEQPRDYRSSEEVTRLAFWDKYEPGANEHFLLHCLRHCEEFLPELCFVAEIDRQGEHGVVVGCIAYSRSKIVVSSECVDRPSTVHSTITFGPISVHPDYQRMAIGKQLIKHSLDVAREMGYVAAIIYGDPRYYCPLGFRCGERFDIKNAQGKYAACLLVYPLQGFEAMECLVGGRFHEGEIFEQFEVKIAEKFEEYDATFPNREMNRDTLAQREFKTLVSLKY